MRPVVPAGRLRRRLAITFALVAAISTGALALGSYLVVERSRLDDSAASSLAQARANLVLAGTVIRADARRHGAARLLDLFRRSGFETVVRAGGDTVSSSTDIGRAQLPGGVQRLVRDGDLAYQRTEIDGTPYVVAGGLSLPSRTELYFLFSERAMRDDLAQLRTILLVGWGIVVVISAAAGALVARRVLRPIAQASAAAHALTEGLLSTRLPVETDDELGAWAASFNEMAQALEEKIDALSAAQARERRFTADVAHELRTPLTALAAEASLLEEHLERLPSDARRLAELLVADVSRMRRLVEELIEISRLDAGRDDGQIEPVDLAALAAGLLRSLGWDARVSLDAQPVVVLADARRLERVLSNLVDNGLIHGGRAVTVQIGRDGDEAIVEVRDGGAGIPPEHLAHVFERFYKADAARAGGGSGLGLAIALEHARLMGGRIEVTSTVGAGSCFTLRLPVAEPMRAGAAPVASGGEDGRP